MTELTEKRKHDICQSAIRMKQSIEEDFLTLGKMLYEIKTQELWRAGWDSWDEYAMEFRFSGPTISKLQRIHEVLVMQYKIEPAKLAAAGGWSSVAEILPLIDPETTPTTRVRELLGLATEQTRKDFRATVFEIKKGHPCKHPNRRRVVIDMCLTCPDRIVVDNGKE